MHAPAFSIHPQRNYAMNKVLAVLIAGFFAIGAYAQQPKSAEIDPTGKG